MTQKAPDAISRYNNFDFIRIFLAVFVIFSHSFSALTGDDRSDWISIATRQQIFGGAMAVDGFFLLSGMLITQSWMKSKTAGDYLRKRVLRIYPGYVVCALLCIFVVSPIGWGNARDWFATLHPIQLARAIVMLRLLELQPFVHNPIHIVNGSLWTIAVEFLCYLLVAAFGLLGAYRHRAVSLALFAACWLFYGIQMRQGWVFYQDHVSLLGGAPNSWPRLFTFFAAGMVAYFYSDRIRYTGLGACLTLAVLAVAARLGGFCFLLPIAGGYLLFWFAFQSRLTFYNIAKRGDYSYGVYLYGWPVQQMLVKFVPDLNPYTLFLATLPPTFLCAYLSWNYIEKPLFAIEARQYSHAARPEPCPLTVVTGGRFGRLMAFFRVV